MTFDFLRLRTLLVLRLLQSFTRAGRCFLSVAAPPLGFRALQRLRSGEPTSPGFAAPGTLRLQGSSALLAPSFSPELHGLVSCRARSWALPFEAFPFAEREPTFRWPLTRMPFARAARGSSPRSSRGLWVFLAPEVRCPPVERSPRTARCSLGLLPSRVSSLTRRPPASRQPPLSSFAQASQPVRCPSESRSHQGRFVSVETTAPPGVLAPRSASR